jgi:hypothetical protein
MTRPCRRPGCSEHDRQRSHQRRQTDHRRRMLGSATTAPTSTERFLYPALLWLEALRRGAVDGVFIARPDGDNLKGDVVELTVDKPKPLRTLTRDVELDSGKPGQIAADMSPGLHVQSPGHSSDLCTGRAQPTKTCVPAKDPVSSSRSTVLDRSISMRRGCRRGR